MPVWKMANRLQWVLCWEDLEVTGSTETWVHETSQSAYSLLATCESSLLVFFVPHVPQQDTVTVDCDDLLGKSFRLDGEEWEVIEADASSGLVKYARFREREDDMEEGVSSEEMEEAIPRRRNVRCGPANRWRRLLRR